VFLIERLFVGALLVKVPDVADRWHCSTFLDHCRVSVHRCLSDLHMLLGVHINYYKFSEIIFEIVFSCVI
jgi:hypothetical protein